MFRVTFASLGVLLPVVIVLLSCTFAIVGFADACPSAMSGGC